MKNIKEKIGDLLAGEKFSATTMTVMVIAVVMVMVVLATMDLHRAVGNSITEQPSPCREGFFLPVCMKNKTMLCCAHRRNKQ